MILDRGFIIVEPKTDFINWIQKYSKDSPIGLDDDLVIKQNYEEIFLYELEISGIDEAYWPEINLDNFNCYFNTTVGVSVVDLKQK